MNLEIIKSKIIEFKGYKVMIDYDLAELYGIETKYLKRAVNRNRERFPSDFLIEINKEEWSNLRCQFGTSSLHGGIRYTPYQFTEQGVAMLASVLQSPKAIEVNIFIVRAFVYMRNLVLSHSDLSDKVKEIELTYNKKFKDVFEALNYLLNKNKQIDEIKERTKIGFKKP
jgi:hypothetical protein